MDTESTGPPDNQENKLNWLERILVNWLQQTATNLGLVTALMFSTLFTLALNSGCNTDSLTGGTPVQPMEEIVVTAKMPEHLVTD